MPEKLRELTDDEKAWVDWAERFTDRERAIEQSSLVPFLAGCESARARLADTTLRTFAVHRPYCSPERVTILARSRDEALWLADRTYGAASDTTAEDWESRDARSE